jgi:Uma2 family endonuclease
MEKMEDYRSVGVLECWLVFPEDETLEVWALDEVERHFIAIYGKEETLTSLAFPRFSLALKDVFRGSLTLQSKEEQK